MRDLHHRFWGNCENVCNLASSYSQKDQYRLQLPSKIRYRAGIHRKGIKQHQVTQSPRDTLIGWKGCKPDEEGKGQVVAPGLELPQTQITDVGKLTESSPEERDLGDVPWWEAQYDMILLWTRNADKLKILKQYERNYHLSRTVKHPSYKVKWMRSRKRHLQYEAWEPTFSQFLRWM